MSTQGNHDEASSMRDAEDGAGRSCPAAAQQKWRKPTSDQRDRHFVVFCMWHAWRHTCSKGGGRRGGGGRPAARAARDEGPEREGSQKKPSASSRPSDATLLRELYRPMKTGMVAMDGRHPASNSPVRSNRSLTRSNAYAGPASIIRTGK